MGRALLKDVGHVVVLQHPEGGGGDSGSGRHGYCPGGRRGGERGGGFDEDKSGVRTQASFGLDD